MAAKDCARKALFQVPLWKAPERPGEKRPAGPQGRIRSSAKRIREARTKPRIRGFRLLDKVIEIGNSRFRLGRTVVPPPIARMSRPIDMPNPQVLTPRVAKTDEVRVNPMGRRHVLAERRRVGQVVFGCGRVLWDTYFAAPKARRTLSISASALPLTTGNSRLRRSIASAIAAATVSQANHL